MMRPVDSTPPGNRLALRRNAVTRPALALCFAFTVLLLSALGAPLAADSDATTGRSLATIDGPDGYPIVGAVAGDQTGLAMQNAGDVNGDGLEDFVLGAAAADPGGRESAGIVYILYGRTDTPTGLLLANPGSTKITRLYGVNSGDRAGTSVSGAGDFNGDGFDDIIIGAPGYDTDEIIDNGAAYVVFGGSNLPSTIELSSLTGTAGLRIIGADDSHHAGAAVGGGGDVNGDGLDDIVIGAPDATTGGNAAAGLSYVIYGNKSNVALVSLSALAAGAGYRARGFQADSNAGSTVAIGGDLNRDGLADVVIAAPRASKGTKGEIGVVFVVYGKTTQTADFSLNDVKGALGFRMEGIDAGHQAGYAAAKAGDVNGDGFGDLIIGSPQANDGTGEAYVVLGRAVFSDVIGLGTLTGNDGYRLVAADDRSQTGSDVSSAGDVNGDGLDDVIIGAPGAGPSDYRFAGEAYLVFGRAASAASVNLNGLDSATGLQFDGIISGDQAGQSVAAAGDTNGDGFDDFLIGAPRAGTLQDINLGYSYLIYGGPSLAITLPVTHPGTANNDALTGGASNDVMIGGRGNDAIDGQAGHDVLKGGAGDDSLLGRSGADRMRGGRGIDTISYAGSSSGVVVSLLTGVGSAGDADGDVIESVEAIIGSGLADTLIGNARNNTLTGGGGNDMLTGGRGDDTFIATTTGGLDTHTDFTPGAGSIDRVDLGQFPTLKRLSDLSLSQQGANTLLTLPDGGSITFMNVSPASLHEDDFRFGDAPVALGDSYSTTAGKAIDVAAPGVLANDKTPVGKPMTAVLVSNVASGSLTLRADGSFRYAPAAGFAGTVSFSYRANNGILSNVAIVQITVTAAAPVARGDSYRATAGQQLVIKAPGVLANDTGSNLTAVLVSSTLEGTLQLNPDGSFTYLTNTNIGIVDSFTYRASNGLNSNIVTVTIEVLTESLNFKTLMPSVMRP